MIILKAKANVPLYSHTCVFRFGNKIMSLSNYFIELEEEDQLCYKNKKSGYRGYRVDKNYFLFYLKY